ncbi:MAG TPA: hypothetical protein VM347_12650 [Nonomuraea sp.]|nr:hypothetical protein [Nonomuraea sp.]
MAIYNAWCDRAPVVVIAGSGPLDEDRRKAWIAWIHATSDPAAPIRPFVKFDVGQQFTDPVLDLGGLARAQGLQAWGPVSDRSGQRSALEPAVAATRAGGTALVDVLVDD